MCKKLVIFLVAILAGVILLKKTQFGSLVTVWWNDTQEKMEQKIEPSTRIKQLRVEIGKIDGQLKEAANNLARQEVLRDQFRDEVEALRKKVAKERTTLEGLVEGLEGNSAFVTVEGVKLSQGDAQGLLDRKRNDFENHRNTLKNREDILQTREKTIKEADNRIATIRSKKSELELLAQNLELQLEQLKLKQLENHIVIDGSQVSKCEELAKDIQTRLKIEDQKAVVFARHGLTSSDTTPEKDSKASREESIKAARAALQAEAAGQK